MLGCCCFCLFLPIFVWNILLVCLILSLVFPILSFLSICTDYLGMLSFLSLLSSGTLHSVEYIFPFILYLLLLFFSQLFVSPQTITLPSCISFSERWFWLLAPVQCCEPPSINFQALYLPDLFPWMYSLLSLYSHKRFDFSHTWMAYWFSMLFFFSIWAWIL